MKNLFLFIFTVLSFTSVVAASETLYRVEITRDCYTERNYLNNVVSRVEYRGDVIDGGILDFDFSRKVYFDTSHYKGHSSIERCERFAKGIKKRSEKGMTKKEIKSLINGVSVISATVYR